MNNRILYTQWIVPVLFFLFNPSGSVASSVFSQDTVKMTLQDATQLFLSHSFQLLAARYQVSAADAAVIQAKLYPNPNLSVDQGAYNPSLNKWFDITKSGETAASLQQVILLAGKRNKQISLAKINAQITSFQFYDLIRTLRYELNTTFYSLFYSKQSVIVYDREISSLNTLLKVYSDQYEKGNIAFKELARLQALQFNLQNERIDILKDVSEKESVLNLLTGDTLMHIIEPVVGLDETARINSEQLNITALLDSALINRFDLQLARSQVQQGETNVALQKALRVPDVTLGANWDRQGSYIYNYNSVSLGLDLPLWNRNQGNIKVAQSQLEAAKEQAALTEMQVKNDVSRAFSEVIETDHLFRASAPQFNSNYDRLLDGIARGYQEHTISLLEFIDYYETYKSSKIEFNRLQNNRLAAWENLSLATGIQLK